MSDCKKYLFAKTTPIEELNGQQYKLVSTFEDAIGKIHTWSLRDADKNASAMKIDAVLELLSSLSIFEKDGVRRFVKLENSEIDNCTRHLKIRKGEIVEESAQTSASQTEAAKPSFDFSRMSEEERLQLVEMLLPEGIVLADTRSEGHKENPDSLPEKSIATSQEPESTSGAVTSIVEETPEPVEENKKPKNPQSIYKKPKSKKQIAIEEKTDLMKRKNKGQSNPKIVSVDEENRAVNFIGLIKKKRAILHLYLLWANNFRVNLNNFTLPAICRPLKIGISCSYDSSGKVLR